MNEPSNFHRYNRSSRAGRLVLSVALWVLIWSASAIQAAAAPVALALGQPELETVERIQAYLNSIDTVSAQFLQASSNGALAEGNVYISRPGRLRIEYAPPVPVLIVADGTFLIYHDKELNQVSYIPLGSTPAGILLDDRISLTGGDLTITGFRQDRGSIEVTLVRTENPMEGSLTLVFTDSPLTLRQWAVTDAQGLITNVSLVKATFGIPLDPELFRFKNPKLFQDRFD